MDWTDLSYNRLALKANHPSFTVNITESARCPVFVPDSHVIVPDLSVSVHQILIKVLY